MSVPILHSIAGPVGGLRYGRPRRKLGPRLLLERGSKDATGRSKHGSRSTRSNGTTLRRASRHRMALESLNGRLPNASTSTCSSASKRPARSPKTGGSTTTPTDRKRASKGSHQPSSQHAPGRAKLEQTLLMNGYTSESRSIQVSETYS